MIDLASSTFRVGQKAIRLAGGPADGRRLSVGSMDNYRTDKDTGGRYYPTRSFSADGAESWAFAGMTDADHWRAINP